MNAILKKFPFTDKSAWPPNQYHLPTFLILEQQPNVGDSENQEEVVDIEPVQRILHSVKYEKDDLKSRVQQKHQEVPRGLAIVIRILLFTRRQSRIGISRRKRRTAES